MDGYRALIADDDPAIREGLPLLVDWAGEGFLVAGAAENGRRALELLQREPFDLLFTDIRMPVMDGLLLAGHAQALQRPPVVAILSAFGDFTYAQSAMRHGVRHYLLKPVGEQALLDMLREARRELDARPKRPDEQPPRRPNPTLDPIIGYIRAHSSEKLSLRSIASMFYVNPSYLGRIFHREVGVSFNEYLIDCRMEQAERLLKTSAEPIVQIAGRVGYDDCNHFTRLFKARTGSTPSEYRNR